MDPDELCKSTENKKNVMKYAEHGLNIVCNVGVQDYYCMHKFIVVFIYACVPSLCWPRRFESFDTVVRRY